MLFTGCLSSRKFLTYRKLYGCTLIHLWSKKGTDVFNQDVIYADDNFFSVFLFPLLSGNPKTVLLSLNVESVNRLYAPVPLGCAVRCYPLCVARNPPKRS
jgi:hypothetical protein